jgi:hypothetical protein
LARQGHGSVLLEMREEGEEVEGDQGMKEEEEVVVEVVGEEEEGEEQ